MSTSPKSLRLEEAVRDLDSHTLGGIPSEIGRLVYLASTRDYNTGQYYHDGLAFRFTEELARTALAEHHKASFRKLVFSPLKDLVRELEAYMTSAGLQPTEFLEVWKRLQPYRVAIPLECDALAVELFFSNIRMALTILENRREMKRDN